jgi:2-isopropylmalate synthase
VFDRSIPPDYPVVGLDAFRTTSGVHAAAIAKAEQQGDTWLADRVYSSVPASAFGVRQRIEIGPMSGAANVRHWLRDRGLPDSPSLVERVLDAARASPRVLTEALVLGLVRR